VLMVKEPLVPIRPSCFGIAAVRERVKTPSA
jgi:hypothetical protein